jgi:hypothetical protein
MNAQKRLASINPTRHLTHEKGQQVNLWWDDQAFHLSRRQFGQFVRALERGARYLFAEFGAYCVVHVDDDLRELWLEGRCITLTRADYRALLNAALTTETRLHGFRDTQPDLTPHPKHVSCYRPPRAISSRWN